jgi:hypothetical protein
VVARGRGALLGDGGSPAEAGAPGILLGSHGEDEADPLDPNLYTATFKVPSNSP